MSRCRQIGKRLVCSFRLPAGVPKQHRCGSMGVIGRALGIPESAAGSEKKILRTNTVQKFSNKYKKKTIGIPSHRNSLQD
eukprot:3820978-Amphidinium_carterae.1